MPHVLTKSVTRHSSDLVAYPCLNPWQRALDALPRLDECFGKLRERCLLLAPMEHGVSPEQIHGELELQCVEGVGPAAWAGRVQSY